MGGYVCSDSNTSVPPRQSVKRSDETPSDLMGAPDYAYDKTAIPPIIREIETALVARVRISTDSSNKRKGAMLKKLP